MENILKIFLIKCKNYYITGKYLKRDLKAFKSMNKFLKIKNLSKVKAVFILI